jgi:hypothetical protein
MQTALSLSQEGADYPETQKVTNLFWTKNSLNFSLIIYIILKRLRRNEFRGCLLGLIAWRRRYRFY